MAQNYENASPEKDEASAHYDVADNGSIILAWMLIAILVIFVGFSVALHEPATIDVVQDNQSIGIDENIQSDKVKHPVPEAKQIVPIENEENLIHTRILI